MDEQTITALRKSIEHWRQNAEGPMEEVTIGGGDCELCNVFYYCSSEEAPVCSGCPVMERTGKVGCSDSPYSNVYFALGTYERIKKADAATLTVNTLADAEATFRAAAKCELDFLISLLP